MTDKIVFPWLPRVLLLVLCALMATAPSPGGDAGGAIADRHRVFLEECELLLSKSERKAFLALDQDYQRDGFIRRFWEARDPYPETTRNEFRSLWEGRLEEARRSWGGLREDRARTFLLHGEPSYQLKTDCGLFLWPIEIWRYDGTERLPRGYSMIFVQRAGGGPYRLWRREDGFKELQALFQETEDRQNDDYLKFRQDVYRYCIGHDEAVMQAVDSVVRQKQMHMDELVELRPKVRDDEWLDTFRSFSTELPADAATLSGRLELRFPALEGARTVVQALLLFEGAESATDPANPGATNFEVQATGEILRQDELFESFRYRFTVPAPAAPASPAIVFERLLRPGEYRLVLRVDDLRSGRALRLERPLVVPASIAETPASPAVEAAFAAIAAGLDRGGEQGAAEDSTPHLDLVSIEAVAGFLEGPQRFEARVTGKIAGVRFLLDEREMLTKRRAPWSVDLDLGALPRARVLRAVALDDHGQVVASDELALNQPPQRFAARLLEPRAGEGAKARQASAEITVPDGERLDRVEFFLGDKLIATLWQAPWSIALPRRAPDPRSGGPGLVRVVAFLDDGLAAEDTVLLDLPEFSETVDVRLVELYVAVTGADRRPLTNLAATDFSVFEDGKAQSVERFEPVADRPLRLLLAVDTSASMTERLDDVRASTRGFFARLLRPKDRFSLVTFSDRPSLAAEFTNDLELLNSRLAAIAPERGTAIWDALVFSLHYLQGAAAQPALVVLSDGADRSSRFTFEQALEFAQRAGISVYAIGTEVPAFDRMSRGRLCGLAEGTGGRCFFISSQDPLDPIVRSIEDELRSRYLLVYSPPSPPAGARRGRDGDAYRQIEVRVARPGAEVRAPTGYWP